MKIEEEMFDAQKNEKKRSVITKRKCDTFVSEDATLIEELLSAQVPLFRVIRLFHGRVEKREVIAIARRLVCAAKPREEKINETNSQHKRNNIDFSILGMGILEQSQSATKDSDFMRIHTENLAKDAPEDLLDPLFQTIMRNPVLLSSGHIVDKSTVLDEEGELKFRTCPWTREPLQKQVYPIVEKITELKEFKIHRINAMIDTATWLLNNLEKKNCQQNLTYFYKLQSSAELFLDDIGTGTYKKIELRLSELSLAAFEKYGTAAIPIDCIQSNQVTSHARFIANIFTRIFRALPPPMMVVGGDGGRNNESDNNDTIFEHHTDENEKKRTKYLQKVTLLEQKLRDAIEEERFDDAIEWCDACETVVNLCGDDLVKIIAVNRLRLEIGRRKGDTDLIDLQRCVYYGILRNDSKEAAQKFLDEEGIDDPRALRDLRPIFLSVLDINNFTSDEEWHEALRSAPLEGNVSRVMVTVNRLKDQECGNAKGKLGLALYDANETLVARCDLFGTYRSESYSYGSSPYRTLKCGEDDVVSKARPGFTYKLEYVVGGGGGHKIEVEKWTCRIFFKELKREIHVCYPLKDPDGDEGIYIGPVNENNKANGDGRLEYYDGMTFIGTFSNDSLVSGVCYSEGGIIPLWTMIGGKWTTTLDKRTVMNFPLDVNKKSVEGIMTRIN